jgi:hypothetical protein
MTFDSKHVLRTLWVTVIIGLFVFVSSSHPQTSQIIAISIEVVGAQKLRGWSVSVSFDQERMAYARDSFAPSGIMPQLQALVLEGENNIQVGGALLGGSSISGDGLLGELQFVMSEIIEPIEMLVTEFAINVEDGGEQRWTSRTVVQVRNELSIADFTGNSVVDFSDFFLFADHFGGEDPLYDIVPDGVVDFSDFFLFADAFGGRSQMVGKIVIMAENVGGLQEVDIIGSVGNEGVGTVEIVGTIAPEDTVYVEVIGTISK